MNMNKQHISKKLADNTAKMIPHRGKSKVWDNFCDIITEVNGKKIVIKDFVACKTCKAVYNFSSSTGITTLSGHTCNIKTKLKLC